jgi:hypothetical protein
MMSENNERETGPAFCECRRPPFPIFPVVVPFIFPFGVIAMTIMRTRHRRRALEARLSEVEKTLAALTEIVPQSEEE